MSKLAVFWFRRDLRLNDNAGLYHALRSGYPVLPLFIFDTNILDRLEDRDDARVTFIHDTIVQLHAELGERGTSLLVRHGSPSAIWRELTATHDIAAVFANRDYEPYATRRDEEVAALLLDRGIPFNTFKDHVIFEKDEVLKSDGAPYTVFTPYSRRWLERLDSRPEGADEAGEDSYYLRAYPTERYFDHFHHTAPLPVPALESMGFRRGALDIPPREVPRGRIGNYDKTRDIPALEGTTRLGIHFRFGTISIREKARRARLLNETFLRELIWRDFYAMILAHFPRVVNHAFRPEYDAIEWRQDEEGFRRWCEGLTGYPIVDAGMRQLNASGYMHNRVRMITASFLTKHLLIDWRWGEAYFARKLLDYELASNNGGWQWAAGSGTDAAPYFRIFNPISQQEKFDPAFKYVKQWVPEFGTARYPKPMVDHKMARARCLEVFKAGLERGRSGG